MNALTMLNSILSLRRPAHSKTEQRFADWIHQTVGGELDSYGNLWVEVDGDTTTLFSCHTDTVSKDEGEQLIVDIDGIIQLVDGKPGQSLGADDGAGCWLMIQMIKAKVPGVYIFHRDEEIGGHGSRYIADSYADRLKLVQRAVAFDRRGTSDVITHQAGGRCCSDEFAQALASQLGHPYKPYNAGVFTDTANYTSLIPECTNISVGYENEHGPRETLDLNHLLTLLTTLTTVSWSQLPTVRDPKVVEMPAYRRQRTLSFEPSESFVNVVKDRPEAVALLLEYDMGIYSAQDLNAALDELEWEFGRVA